jgi:predicted  nucleic acid-binding Zn-ribbon protein
LNEQLKFLIELQELDSVIISVSEKIDLLPRKLDKFKTPLQEAKVIFQKAKSKQDSLTKKKKDSEQKLDEIQDKIEKLKARSSDIKTNKEYEAHLREIQTFEKNISKIEDEILAVMEELDTYESDLKEEELKLKSAEEEFEQQEKIIGEEQKKLDVELEAKKAMRDEYASKIDKSHYTHYMNLLNRFGDKAVAETKNEICLGCNTNIPPQLFNDIKKNDDIYHCFYCKRYLYYKENLPSENAAQDTASTS